LVGSGITSSHGRVRTLNQGLRLDYFLCSKALLPRVHDSWVFDADETKGVSDHCPIGLQLMLD